MNQTNYNLLIENYIQSINFKAAPEGLYDAIKYIINIGGKRIRPQLVLMGCEIFNGEITQVLPAAAAIELFHNFSLIHDDIMDNATLRRGKPTVHTQFDTNTAILSGDAAVVLCYEELLKLPLTKSIPDSISLFNKTALEVCEGQQYDMLFEKRSDVTVDEYLEMIRLKTAVLLGCALQLGSLLAGADEKNQQLIYQFGMNIGIAFQLQDDILDTFGNPEKFGKKVGGDIIQNKKTFLLLKAIQLANQPQAKVLNEWLNKNEFNETEKVEKIKSIFEEIGVRKIAEQQMQNYYQSALQAVDELNVTDANKKQLIAFADLLMNREH